MTQQHSSNWNNDLIQFPRLLSEILATGLPEQTINELCESMDLEASQIMEILERADKRFEEIKEEQMEADTLTSEEFFKRIKFDATNLFDGDLASYAVIDMIKNLVTNWLSVSWHKTTPDYQPSELIADVDKAISLLLEWKSFLLTGKQK